jgi:hypothetical protein
LWKARVTTNIRHRGEDYHSQRRVQIEQGSPSQLLAHVQGSGSGSYDIELFWNSGTLSVWCDCCNFVDHATPCKHLWAGILAADEHNYLSAAAAARYLAFDVDGLHLQNQIPDSPKRPPWEKQLRGILTASATPSMTWPANFEPLYVIDVQGTIRGKDLVLLLQRRERKADGSWKPAKPLGLKRSEPASGKLSA